MKNIFHYELIKHRSTMSMDPVEYSKFKYGCKAVARKFGVQLGKAFCEQYITDPSVFKGKQVVVYPSPYFFIPTATYALKDYFITTLNEHLVEIGLEPAIEAKIYRKPSYTQDYGKMSVEEREKVISGDSFYIDKTFAEDKFCIFLDDIRITGAHERRIVQMLELAGLQDIDHMYMYYAYLKPENDMPESADIEDYLNLNAISGLKDINRIIRSDEGFLFNTRVVKYILSAEQECFNNFIEYQTDTFIRTLYHYSLGNGYNKGPEFAENFKTLKEIHNTINGTVVKTNLLLETV